MWQFQKGKKWTEGVVSLNGARLLCLSLWAATASDGDVFRLRPFLFYKLWRKFFMKKFNFFILATFLVYNIQVYAQWEKTNLISNGWVNSFAVSGSNIFVGGDGGVFLSSNNGLSWTDVSNNLPSSGSVHSLIFSGSNLFAGTDNHGVYKSSDNGENWVGSNNGLIINDALAFVVSGLNIFVSVDGGSLARVFRSTDNGASWINVTNNITSTGDIVSFTILGSNLFAGSGIGVNLTTDNGLTWTYVSNGIPSNAYVKALTVSGSAVFAGTINSRIFISNNNGITWNGINNGLPNRFPVTALTNIPSNLFASSDSNGVYLSKDNGNNWISVNTGLTDMRVNTISIANGYIFAGTINGSVWRRQLSEIISIQNISSEIPTAFFLYQNYPNPFNPVTNIEFSLSEKSFCELKLFDLKGRQVAVLVNENLSPGTFRYIFKVDNLSSGIYFYELKTPKFLQVKKMIVLK